MKRKWTRRAEAPTSQRSGNERKQGVRRVFISYRREDTDAAAAHLYASLSQKLGADSVFRDLAAIQPGEDFPAVIEAAIGESTAVLALIGQTWLTAERNGRRRLDDPADLVRREIEIALHAKVPVIPVLVGGAKMPTRAQLPRTIAELASRNAYSLPWQDAIDRLSTRIDELERERIAREETARADRARLDLTAGRRIGSVAGKGSYDIAIRAMEMSLAHQGRRRSLDSLDLAASLTRMFPSFAADGGYMLPDLFYVIDVVGVKATGSKDRFVARSYPLRRIDDIPSQLQLGRPVLAGMTAFESWNREPATTTGFIDDEKSGHIVVAFMGAVLGWDPLKQQFRVLVPWPKWGDKGIATLTMKAAHASFDMTTLRSIEPVLKSTPDSPIPATDTTTGRKPPRPSGTKAKPASARHRGRGSHPRPD